MRNYLIFCCILLLNSAAWAAQEFNIKERFDVTKKGERVEININVSQRSIYVFGLSFYVKNGDINDMPELIKALDNTSGVNETAGKNKNSLIRVGIDVDMVGDGEDFHFSNETADLPVYSWGKDYRNKRIVYLNLEKGNYKVVLRNINPAPEFKDRAVFFYIRKAYLGK